MSILVVDPLRILVFSFQLEFNRIAYTVVQSLSIKKIDHSINNSVKLFCLKLINYGGKLIMDFNTLGALWGKEGKNRKK